MNLRLHPSNLEDWQACGKKFQFGTVMGLKPSHLHPAGLNGTAVHIAIARIHSEGLWDSSEDELVELYNDGFRYAIENPVRKEERGVPIRWGEYENERTAMATMARDSVQILQGYKADPRNRNARVVLADANWRATFGGFDWEGTLDQARQTEHGIELFDFKTSREPLEDVPRAMWPQGLTYVLGMQHGVFRPVRGSEEEPWTPVAMSAVAVNWVQLKEYIPYKKGGSRKDGSKYAAGEVRGPVFYRTVVTDAALKSHLKEISYFAQAVKAERFERRPHNRTCNYECRFNSQCLAEFGLKLEGLDSNRVQFEED